MKKIVSVLLLMFTATLLLTSCTPLSQRSPDITESTTNNNDAPDPPIYTLNGIWYSEDYQTVLDLTDLSHVTYYELKIGFYEYANKTSATCEYVDNIVTLTMEDGTVISWVFDPYQNTLSLNDEDSLGIYERKDTLPTEYQSLLFPDYSQFNCSSLLTLGAHTGLTAPVDIEKLVAADLFIAYYDSYDDDPTTLTDKTVAQMGDLVKVDYKGYLDGVAFEGGEAEGADILISAESGYIPGFAEGIAGHEVGTSFDVHVTFPEDYGSDELAGKAVVFTMKLHAIYDLRLPDDKIPEFSENAYTTYEEMLAGNVNQAVSENWWSQLVDSTNYEEMPENAYAFFLQYYREMYHYYAYYYGMEYETLLSYYGITDAYLTEQCKEIAKNYMTAYALIEKYDIPISDALYNEILDSFINDYIGSGETTYEEAKAYVLEHESNSLHAEIAIEAAMSWLAEQNSVQ